MSETSKSPFPYKTPPFGPYQREALMRSWSWPYAALTMEQGTGKTWVTINTAAALWLHGKITGMIVTAPNGVHTAWAREQLPQHMPDAVLYSVHVWDSSDELTKWRRAKRNRSAWDFKEWLHGAIFVNTLPILCINSESITTPVVKNAIELMLRERRCLFVVDESGDFMSPSGKRAKRLMKWRNLAAYRRILDGTPVGVSPFELYVPYRFLSPSIIGCDTLREMQNRYAEWDEFERPGTEPDENGRRPTFRVLRVRNGQKAYKNLEGLAKRIAPFTIRVTKAEALPHLPPKIPAVRYFKLSPEQRRLTNELWESLTTTLPDGNTVTVGNKLTLYLRLQQIAAGYVPPDVVYGEMTEETQPVSIIEGPNPRLDTAMDMVRRWRGEPTIIWTRFQFDIDLLAAYLRDSTRLDFVTYDGRTSTTAREEAKLRFQANEAQVFLGNAAAGGRGLNLFRAQHVLFYNNYWGLRKRAQAEDRAHRIGTAHPVTIADVIGEQSIDVLIKKARQRNIEVAALITGDPITDFEEGA